MTRKWIRRLAAPAAVFVALTMCATTSAQADPVSYRCSSMSIIMTSPLTWETFIFANGCDGPLGTFSDVTFIKPPPYSAEHCETTYAFQVDGEKGARLNGHDCD